MSSDNRTHYSGNHIQCSDNYVQYLTEFFTSWAWAYDLLTSPFYYLRKIMADRIGKKHSKILDVACGTGDQSLAFARRGHKVIGIDITSKMLEYAKKKITPALDMKFMLHDASRLPFKDNRFDAASIGFAVHEMPDEIAVKVLREMKRVTKKGGKILITDHSHPANKVLASIAYHFELTFETKYFRRYMELGLDHYLNKAGLKPVWRKKKFLGVVELVECRV